MMVDQKITHKPPSIFHALGLHPARHMQPAKPPLLLLMSQRERDEFRRRQETLSKQAAEPDKKEEQETPLKTLLSQTPSFKKGVLWHLTNQTKDKSDQPDSPKSSKASSGSTTPSEAGDRYVTSEYLLNLPPATLLSVLNKLSPIPSVASQASLDSFVHVGSSSRASSSHGDHHEVRSLPDSMPGSPWLSLPHSPFMSKTHSHLRLTQAALETKPVSKHEDSDSDDETVEESTATLKP